MGISRGVWSRDGSVGRRRAGAGVEVRERRHSRPGNVNFDGEPAMVGAGYPLLMVYGGGGAFGIGFNLGVAHGLAAAGVAVAAAPALGTSAGSWAASAMALGIEFEAFEAVESPSVPNRKRGVLADLARRLWGESRHPLVAVSAVCVSTRRRHILDGARYPLADLVAASSAVPGLLPPHRIDGRLYVDGGMWSATSIDAAANAEEVIVVAPLAGVAMGPLGFGAGFLLERELRGWRHQHPGSRITMIRPNRAIAQLAGRNPLGLFDGERGKRVYPLAYRQGLQWGERLQEGDAA
jgi:predicted acylesterase/phospholipase RssA